MSEKPAQAVSDLIAIHLKEYEKLRDEIRMRITQRHQFTSYSLLLFIGILSLLGTAFARQNQQRPEDGFPFAALSSEILLFLLLTPPVFFSLLFMYIKHDYYIVKITTYLDRHLGGRVRDLMGKAVDRELLADATYLLGWERVAQLERQARKGQLSFVIGELISDLVTKYTPFLFPPFAILAIAWISLRKQGYHGALDVVLGFEIAISGFVVFRVCAELGGLAKRRYIQPQR